MSAVFFPESLEACFDLRRQYGDALVMAGGTDLLVAERKTGSGGRPLVCLERVVDLRQIAPGPDGGIVIGAAAPLSAVIRHPLVAERYPLLAMAAATVGGPAIRNMATIGGNICTASPAGDCLPPLYLLEARLELSDGENRRRVPVDTFITGPKKTVLSAGELLTAVHLPAPGDFAVRHFEKVGRRNALAVAVASLAALIRLDEGNRVAEARLAWGSVGPCVVRCPEAEDRLTGRPLSEASLREAGEAVRRTIRPIDDIRATAEYRRMLAANLLLRLERP